MIDASVFGYPPPRLRALSDIKCEAIARHENTPEARPLWPKATHHIRDSDGYGHFYCEPCAHVIMTAFELSYEMRTFVLNKEIPPHG